MYKNSKLDEKECNTVLQNKLSKITHVYPKEDEKEISKNDPNSDILDSVRPFFFILQLIGMQQMTFKGREIFPTKWFYKLYSLMVALAILGIQSYVLYDQYTTETKDTAATATTTMTMTTPMTASMTPMIASTTMTTPTAQTPPPKSPAAVVTELLKVIPPSISAIICLAFSATSYQNMIIRVLNNYKIVDKQLVIQNSNIYKPMRNKIIVFVTGMLFLSVLMNGFDFWVNKCTVKAIIISLVISLNEFVLLEVCILLYIVTTRLDVLNTQLNATKYDASKLFNNEVSIINKRKDLIMMSMVDNLGNINAKSNKNLGDEEQLDDVIRLMKVYDRLADNANIVNSCFGIPLLSSAIAAFMNILSTVNDLISLNKDAKIEDDDLNNINLAIWCLRDVLFVVLVTIVIETMLSRVKKTSNIINKLSINPKIDPAREELLDRFSQLMSCRKFTITACNFFPFDFTFIYSLVGAIATYTVIILQVNPPTKTTAKTE